MFDLFERLSRGYDPWSTAAYRDPLYQRYLDDLHSRWASEFGNGWRDYAGEKIEQAVRSYVKYKSDFDRFVDFRYVSETEPIEDDSLYDEIDLTEIL